MQSIKNTLSITLTPSSRGWVCNTLGEFSFLSNGFYCFATNVEKEFFGMICSRECMWWKMEIWLPYANGFPLIVLITDREIRFNEKQEQSKLT